MFCTQCGSRNGEYDRFCTSCGAALEAVSQEDALRDQPGENLGDPAISVQEPAQGDDGLPADIVGRGVAGVKADLESRGYAVKTEKRLSSKNTWARYPVPFPAPAASLVTGRP